MTQTGYILLADISGYTKFLGATELEHAQGILHDLLQAMIDQLRLPLVLSSVRGDAIVAHAPHPNLPDGEHLMEAVEAIYNAFRGVLVHMERNTTCPCAACKAIPTLELKTIVHHGEYVVQELAGRPELHGSDVVTAFRLLKNDVITATGIEAYAAFTEATVEAMGRPGFVDDMVSHRQPTEEFGEVLLHVADMRPAWESHAALTRVRVEDDAPRYFEDVQQTIAAPVDYVWTLICDPAVRHRWFPNVDHAKVDKARRGVGATIHCAHSSGPPTIYTIVDAEPFEYSTFDVHLPMGGELRMTLSVEAGAGQGEALVRAAAMRARANNPVAQTVLRLLLATKRKAQRQGWVTAFESLSQLAEETCARHVPTAAVTMTDEDLRRETMGALSE